MKTIAAEASKDVIRVVSWSVLPVLRMFGWKWLPSAAAGNRVYYGNRVTAEQGMEYILLGIFAFGPQCGCSFRDLEMCTRCERDGGSARGRWVVLDRELEE